MESIPEKIRAYRANNISGEHGRERSWEHCYRYFHNLGPKGIAANRDCAALQLGFYLASWGMYRGSSFLLQYAYTVHKAVIDQLATPELSVLWDQELGTGENDALIVPLIFKAINALWDAYKPFGNPTDTLITKVLLGTLGCLPACDRFFIDGFKSSGLAYSYLNLSFVMRVLKFCRENLTVLREEQDSIEQAIGIRYPCMKIVDM